jgi:hypothetical protein
MESLKVVRILHCGKVNIYCNDEILLEINTVAASLTELGCYSVDIDLKYYTS